MLKVRHLFDNRPLAELLLGHWPADAHSAELMNRFRISSNAVYPFSYDGKSQLLRFAPDSEKSRATISAELDFIAYLRAAGYPALQPVASSDGAPLVTSQTQWGLYHATAFTRVPGMPLGETDLNDTVVHAYGVALGRLHTLSSQYVPAGDRRWSHADVLDWIAGILPQDHPGQGEAVLLRQHFAAFPTTSQTYGLIHYDFECDNVFFDAATGTCWAIDFDDSMYHWFAMDMEQAIDSLLDEVPAEEAASKTATFLAGYASAHLLDDDMLALRPACRRFADLYWVARAWRATAETLVDEPGWLVGLRSRIAIRQGRRTAVFGTPI